MQIRFLQRNNHKVETMKKYVISMVLYLCALGSVQAQNTTPLEEIEKGWGMKTINNVVNSSLGIMLERFDQTWPTWMGGAIRATMEKGLANEVLDEETALTVTVDMKNGYSKTAPLKIDD